MIDRESKVIGVLMTHLRTPGVLPPSFVSFRHEDRINAGRPDISITGNNITLWLEVKLADPYIRQRGIQKLTMLRLGNAGFAYYVIYYDKKKQRSTHIVHPQDMKQWPDESARAAVTFDHSFVSDFILEVHGVHKKL
jgi:hypothetical protein